MENSLPEPLFWLIVSAIIILSIVILSLFDRINLPGLIGLVMLGVILGLSLLNTIDSTLLSISAEVRLLALIVILMRAGLGLNRRVIKKTCPVFFVLILSVCLSYIC
ncbi:hypothetical protein V512_010110 [Mesotoga sp. Brook.08.105.5.1]|nr:hypothetical protein V512_010110 [Mesotoga sp. Brook.08.105.5.1]RAO98008.1 hypothetical protein M388_08050 [Mesotoga sp. Brook.08.YT.4.2.5.4.]